MPDGIAEADVRSIARSESAVMLSGGQASLPVVQIGHMGPAAYPLGPVIGLVALGQALRRAGAQRTSALPSRPPSAAIPITRWLNPKTFADANQPGTESGMPVMSMIGRITKKSRGLGLAP